MADVTEKTENGELVTNREQLIIVDNIESLIKVIRGQQVMLDRDLATLYGVETKRLNEQVKRNIKRFPEDFIFQLTKDECLRAQIATLNEGRGQHLSMQVARPMDLLLTIRLNMPGSCRYGKRYRL